MITKHTPGPWTLTTDGLVAASIGKFAPVVASLDGCSNAAANGALIAAAPDLLAALRDILALVNMTPAGHERETLELIADRVAAEGIKS